jgi:hypothetical protein
MADNKYPDPSVNPPHHNNCYAIVNYKKVKRPKRTRLVVWTLINAEPNDTTDYRFHLPAIQFNKPDSLRTRTSTAPESSGFAGG